MNKEIRNLEFACLSITGQVRSHNEDNISFFGKCLPEEHGDMKEVFYETVSAENRAEVAVFDGMGGEQAGEKASFIAAINMLRFNDIETHYKDKLIGIVRFLNKIVCREKKLGGYKQIGTTMSVLMYGNGIVTTLNVGDSPIFLYRKGCLEMLSVLHREKREFLKNGERKTVLTQFLGIDEEDFLIEPHISATEIISDDIFLICSDGLTDMLDENEIADILHTEKEIKNCVKKLVSTANERGGHDNITVCAMKVSACE